MQIYKLQLSNEKTIDSSANICYTEIGKQEVHQRDVPKRAKRKEKALRWAVRTEVNLPPHKKNASPYFVQKGEGTPMG